MTQIFESNAKWSQSVNDSNLITLKLRHQHRLSSELCQQQTLGGWYSLKLNKNVGFVR